MSADNYYIVRKHPDGGYCFVMGFDSVDEVPVASPQSIQYETVLDAYYAAADQMAEYGVSIHSECKESE